MKSDGIRFKCAGCGRWWYIFKKTAEDFERDGSELIPYCGFCKPPDEGWKRMKDVQCEDFSFKHIPRDEIIRLQQIRQIWR